MRMSSTWRSASFCSASVLLFIGLTGCASKTQHTNAQARLAAEPPLCQSFRTAWVSNFKANVGAMSVDELPPVGPELLLADVRDDMQEAGLDEAQCTRPYCMIQPLAGGKLDSYCGYRIDANQGEEIYQWVPWTGQ
jgi:hypothetical protein